MRKLIVALVAVMILLAACSGDEESATAPLPTDTETPLATDPTTETPTTAPTPTPEPQGEAMSAANADVVFVAAQQQADGRWRFNVTVEHPDTGWEDYADGWDVVLPDGTVVLVNADDPFTRLLLHPHENEQPFTRSQSGLVIPDEVTTVTVRAHDLVDGFGGQEVVVDLTAESGENFTVSRQP